ncbi:MULTISPECIES: 2-succinyl-6-hydroxy-2,4-cyclohexadiene-1-carboxylate synthase [Bacillus]|uniref:Putative 2-succinyl-6-hydroxy-2,4-cyclohexadiene-1-carboxylate synthase n=1 Tax=Bacillus glycinifermentans TaxID=1664069 RepID=A0AAJ3Z0G0_9BACI|nr:MULTISPECIES: 2-succinyl-6-hydroxy-2,4-cyclohexadiene-1-carboxylate synthase [Bacillus]KKB73897.1 esterase [Bacillus sp. TH008]MDU0073530.1 2-succinyl-6-hydroxy-2,4-cyclohexadiene-1-carboxylate synthase [Bacillus sp. IG6]MED8021554.1 2-succinyl-6-hydroxy-2,4-cyclohexadiene-1-carboxylate synthase [Bacillus glycinifermentans]QAT66637.1 2-succinyl-6-hydroxy-2,4-cyclohexadiene-1-carboxylate synthase [Bacillus glycinifermentans]WKB76385.1 2-succinyl-6-hydroxy-2,4-cyclohexadiene-1-carboxylate syn
MAVLRLTLRDGIGYEIEDNGASAEKTAVFLHGFTGSAKTWDETDEHFRGIRLIKLNLLGHGKTDSPADNQRYTTEQQAADLLEIFDLLKLKKVDLVGYSMGGRLALSFAMTHPERVSGLVLESSSPGLQTEEERRSRRDQDARLGERIINEGIESFVDYWEQIPLFASQLSLEASKRKKIREERLSNNPTGLAGSLTGMGTGSQPSWWDKLGDITFPVLLIAGSLDKKFVAINQNMHRKIPGSRLVIAEQTGHAVHVEEPDFFGKIVSEFIFK